MGKVSKDLRLTKVKKILILVLLLLSKFKINHWNKFVPDGTRSNNFVESFNKLINKKLSSALPKIWKFIDLIKKMDNKMAIDLGRGSIELFFHEAPISNKDKVNK